MDKGVKDFPPSIIDKIHEFPPDSGNLFMPWADYAKLEAVKDAWKRWALAFHEYGKAELAGVSGKGMVPVLEEIEAAEQHLRSLGELP